MQSPWKVVFFTREEEQAMLYTVALSDSIKSFCQLRMWVRMWIPTWRLQSSNSYTLGYTQFHQCSTVLQKYQRNPMLTAWQIQRASVTSQKNSHLKQKRLSIKFWCVRRKEYQQVPKIPTNMNKYLYLFTHLGVFFWDLVVWPLELQSEQKTNSLISVV